jgi:hypothetical protein
MRLSLISHILLCFVSVPISLRFLISKLDVRYKRHVFNEIARLLDENSRFYVTKFDENSRFFAKRGCYFPNFP